MDQVRFELKCTPRYLTICSRNKGNNVINPDLKANTIGNILSEIESVANLGVTFSNNAKWTAHVGDILRKCVRFSFFVKKLRR